MRKMMFGILVLGWILAGFHTVGAFEVKTLCRFIDPDSGKPVLGAVTDQDEILSLQAVYSRLNNGQKSPYLDSLEGFFQGGGKQGKALADGLAAQAVRMGYPLIKSADVQLLTPLEPRKLIAGSIFEGHARNARESWARELLPVQWALATMIGGGPFDPPEEHYQEVTYYQGNHLGWFPHRSNVVLPEHWQGVDFEIEIGMLVVREGDGYKIGGFFLFNDITHRKTQGVEISRVKHGFSASKHLNAAGWKFVLAEYVEFSKISATATLLRPNQPPKALCTGHTRDALFTPDQVLDSIARRDGGLAEGEIITTGTLSGCCALEIVGAAEADLLQPGDTIRFESSLLGDLENTIQ